MDIQLVAGAVLKRLLVSLAIFAVGFVSVCVLFRVPSENWLIAMLGALPGCVALIFVVVSAIWFVAQRVRDPAVALRWLLAVVTALLIITAAYKWNRKRMWTLKDPNGRSVCFVQSTWSDVDVSANCGFRSGRGWQPKVPTSGSMCSAPGDVYGSKVVLYGCDGRVQAVEHMPARGFIYPSK